MNFYLTIFSFYDTILKSNAEDGDTMNPKSLDNYQEYHFSVGDTDFTFFSETNSLAYQQNSGTTMHAHRFYELFHVLRGKITIHTGIGDVSLREGDTVIVSPELMHTTQFAPGSLRICMTFSFRKNKNNSGSSYYDAFRTMLSKPYIHTNAASDQPFKRLAYYFQSNHNERDELMISCLHEIMVLLKIAHGSQNASSAVLSDTNSLRTYIVDNYFTMNYQNGSLVKLADLLHLSPQQTQRIIKKMYSKSFSEKIVQSKMQYAKRMLLNSKLPIAQIAANCGYNSTNGFFVAFKKHYGKTPNEFRLEAKS